jgi:CO dehydrogenase nickel-insertion accessory protein CooC1
LVALANQIFTEAKIKSVMFVLNKVKTTEMENHLRYELSKRDIEPIGVIHEDPMVSSAWLNGEPLNGLNIEIEARTIVSALEHFAIDRSI